MGMEGYTLPQENPENAQAPEDLVVSHSEEKTPEPVVEELPETPVETQVEEKTEEPKVEKDIVVDESLKRKGLDFTESLDRVNGRLARIDKDVEIVSSGTLSKFRTATRSLEGSFQGEKIDLAEATNSFNRLTASFQDMSLIQDRELRKIAEDTRKSLVSAIEGSKDSAMALRMNESVAELKQNINRMIDKADEAAHRFRRGAR